MTSKTLFKKPQMKIKMHCLAPRNGSVLLARKILENMKENLDSIVLGLSSLANSSIQKKQVDLDT